MATVNIGNRDDAFYRYKMPKLQTKIEGRGNGIKTIIVNMAEIAAALNRPPSYPTKYFGCELGAMSKYDTKTSKAIVNGKHEQQFLQNLLQEGFIKKFVLCGKCSNPETATLIDKNQNISLECKACGHITHIDPREKMCTFIINNPPDSAATKGGKKAKGAHAQGAHLNIDESDFIQTADDDDEEWSEDVSEEAVRARREEEALSGKLVDIQISEGEKKKKKKAEEEENGEVSPVKLLRDFLELKKNASDKQIQAVVQKIKEDYKLGDKEVVCLLFESFFDPENIASQIKIRAPFFAKYATTDSTRRIVLGYIEKYAASNADALKAVPKILEAFYDADVLEEETILEWAAKKKSRFVDEKDAKKVKQAAAPFIEWLQKAESEDEDEDEDEDE